MSSKDRRPTNARRVFLTMFTAQRAASKAVLSGSRTREKLHELVDGAVAFGESMLKEVSSAAPPERPLACREGCSWCCYIRVGVSEAEVLRIADYLRSQLSAERVEEIRARAAAASESTKDLSAEEHVSARVPCPLLEEGRCIVHEVRPLSCRGYNSYDASSCEELWEAGDGGREVRAYLPQLRVMESVLHGFGQGTRDAGLRSSALVLGPALKVALERPQVQERWLLGHHPFGPAVDEEAQQARDAALRAFTHDPGE